MSPNKEVRRSLPCAFVGVTSLFQEEEREELQKHHQTKSKQVVVVVGTYSSWEEERWGKKNFSEDLADKMKPYSKILFF